MTDEFDISGKTSVRGRPFAKGNAGRKPGSRNKVTNVAQALVSGEEDELIRKGLELAKNGDRQMLKFFLERILPPERPIAIELPPIHGREDLPKALAEILSGVTKGIVTCEQASFMTASIANIAKFMDDIEIDLRIRNLQDQLGRPAG